MWLHKAIVTVLGLGYAPKAPGTFGTLGAFLFIAAFHYSGFGWMDWYGLTFIAFLTPLGIYSTNKVIVDWNEQDPSRVVLDEFVGFLITMLFVPISLKSLIIGFILFRFFDIKKPLGVRYLDTNLKAGMGVMLDDVLAGIYACGFLHILLLMI